MKIRLIPIGDVSDNVISHLTSALNRIFGFKVITEKQISVPAHSLNKQRNQYEAGVILEAIKKQFTSLDEIKLGITEQDLYSPNLNFVFGQAEPDARVAVISLFRLHDENKFLKRVDKEAIHEIGHTLGLNHCPDMSCVMHFSNSLHDTDIKSPAFCSRCGPKLFKLC